MRRAVLTVGGTVAGLVALFSYRTHVPGITPVAEPSTPAALSVTAPPKTAGSGAASSPSPSASKTTAKPKATPKATPSARRTTAPATQQATPTQAPTKQATPTPTPTPTKTTAPPTPTTQQFEGPNVDTQYGPVQVVITVTGGKITAANDAQQPESSVGANAIPQLNQEVLTAQSANIQAVSGATYTSNGYIQSLQQAVNQAGL